MRAPVSLAIVVAAFSVACDQPAGSKSALPRAKLLAEVRGKLDKVRKASEDEEFDLGQVGSSVDSIVGMTRAELTAALGPPDDPSGNQESAQASVWSYSLCHHKRGYRGGCSTLVLDFPREPPGDVVGSGHWEYGK